MFRFLVIALLIYIGYRYIKSLTDKAGGAEEAELVQDPQCGTYFLKQKGVEAIVDGRRLHFCSAACRDAYMRDHQIR